MKLNSYDLGLICLFGMLLFSVYGQVQTEKELDQARAEITVLKAKPLVVNPSDTCTAWWFGKTNILEVRKQVCGRKK